MRKIGLFGGTFNPIHEGHLYLAKKAIEELGLDQLILIPNRVSPFRMNEDIVSFEQRYKMCLLATNSEDKIVVSDIENKLPIPSYTINTIEYFKSIEDAEYYLLIGDDQAAKFNHWKDYLKILDLVKVVVFKRNEMALNLNYPCLYIPCDIHPASSTAIRLGKFKYLNEKVRNYIFDNEIYLDGIVKSKMSLKRYEHSKRVQMVATSLAKIHNLDVNKASLAALLHDICKEMDQEKTNQYMLLESLEAQNMHPNVHHQFVGARYVEEELCMKEKDILDAIRYHTTGGMANPYVYILFIADKIEPGRGYDATTEWEKAKIDLKQAYDYCLMKQLEYIGKDSK